MPRACARVSSSICFWFCLSSDVVYGFLLRWFTDVEAALSCRIWLRCESRVWCSIFSEPPGLCFDAGATETRSEIPVDPEVPDNFLNTSWFISLHRSIHDWDPTMVYIFHQERSIHPLVSSDLCLPCKSLSEETNRVLLCRAQSVITERYWSAYQNDICTGPKWNCQLPNQGEYRSKLLLCITTHIMDAKSWEIDALYRLERQTHGESKTYYMLQAKYACCWCDCSRCI